MNKIQILIIILLSTTITFCTSFVEKTTDSNDEIITETDSLILTPNESFFSPVGTLRAHLRDKSSGNPYNKNEFYDYITEWKNAKDTILFGVNIEKTGSLTIQPQIAMPNSENSAVIYVYINNQKKELTLKATTNKNSFNTQNTVTFKNIEPGFKIVKLQLKSDAKNTNGIGKLEKLILTGNAAEKATVEMRRYRPFAVHCRWQSEATKPIAISVHELTVINTEANVYQPITTPFGYTGSPWSLKTKTFGGYNFSLWSYGANDPVPPFYQESHLIAVGKGLTFGSYGHEGTGVKPRGKNPYENLKTNTQIIAVRKLPGDVYDTYWSYYFHPIEKHWKLYGCGKKYNKKGTKTGLITGAFVEVAGGAHIERSGHEIRESQYSGWQQDTDGNWFLINKMIGTSQDKGLSFREWRTVDNKFSMQTGGWGKPGISKKTLSIQNPKPLPYYLKGDYLKELHKMPASFIVDKVTGINTTSAIINFKIEELGTNPEAEIYFDYEDGLTKEPKWQNKTSVTIKKGDNSFKIDALKSNTKYYYRIKIKNNEGVTWSYNSHSFKTI